ncbi:hypothetical protein [Candidatus Jidaibacter acanthamoebae]|nr:hypothetical protein [Candidatus Jidaibacter acanthamoeba]
MSKINKIPFNNKSLKNELKDKLVNYLEPTYEGGGYAGYGFSSDSQQLSTQHCYNVTTFSSGQHGEVKLNTAYSFSELQKMLKIDVTSKGKFGIFSGSAEAEYMKSIQDDYYSMSLNYLQYMADRVKVQLAGAGQNVLNAFGREIYNSNEAKPYFGLICGDKYIDSYDEGALLTMSINLNFANHYEKEEFKAKASASWGNIFSASGEIQKIANALNIGGSVSIQALQVGGDPSQLSRILNKDSSGKYYALTCDLKAMDNCIKAASGLLDYAVNDFSTQISFKNNTGLTPLGTGFAHSEKIDHIGLTPPKTLVNSTVIEDRNLLSELLETNKSYQQYSDQLINHYPVTWNTNSKLYKNIKTFEKEIEYNIGKILNYNDPSESALGCFDNPEECDFITQNIVNDLVNITNTDLAFLKAIKYTFPLCIANLYKNGDENSWAAHSVPPGVCGNTWGAIIDSLLFTDSTLSVSGRYSTTGMICWYDAKGNSNDGMNYYVHTTWCCGDKWHCDTNGGIVSKQLSPYYEGIEQGFMNNGQMLNQIQLSWEGIESL